MTSPRHRGGQNQRAKTISHRDILTKAKPTNKGSMEKPPRKPKKQERQTLFIVAQVTTSVANKCPAKNLVPGMHTGITATDLTTAFRFLVTAIAHLVTPWPIPLAEAQQPLNQVEQGLLPLEQAIPTAIAHATKAASLQETALRPGPQALQLQ